VDARGTGRTAAKVSRAARGEELSRVDVDILIGFGGRKGPSPPLGVDSTAESACLASFRWVLGCGERP
jgi:hypothetical protein